jgi:hypothetical protein
MVLVTEDNLAGVPDHTCIGVVDRTDLLALPVLLVSRRDQFVGLRPGRWIEIVLRFPDPLPES